MKRKTASLMVFPAVLAAALLAGCSGRDTAAENIPEINKTQNTNTLIVTDTNTEWVSFNDPDSNYTVMVPKNNTDSFSDYHNMSYKYGLPVFDSVSTANHFTVSIRFNIKECSI